MFLNLWTRLKNPPLRNVFTLMSATLAAQIIPVLLSPVLSRMYKPEDWGPFAIFSAAVSLLGILATLRFEHAIMLPKDTKDASVIAALAILSTTLFSLLLFTLATIFVQPLTTILGIANVPGVLWLIPISVFLSGIMFVGNYWASRHQRFSLMAVSRVAQTTFSVGISLWLGWSGWGVYGLISGLLAGQIANAFFLTAFTWNSFSPHRGNICLSNLVMLFQRYRNFPLYSVPAGFVNDAANKIPIFLFNSMFGPGVSGSFAFTQKILNQPVALLACSIGDVYKERATNEVRTSGSCRSTFRSTLKALVLISLLPFGLLMVYGKPLFLFVFGEKWGQAGEFAQILAPMYLVQFSASPLSYTLYVVEKQKVDFLWQISLLACTSLALYFGCLRGQPELAVILFAVSYGILYLINLLISFRYSGGTLSPSQKEKCSAGS